MCCIVNLHFMENASQNEMKWCWLCSDCSAEDQTSVMLVSSGLQAQERNSEPWLHNTCCPSAIASESKSDKWWERNALCVFRHFKWFLRVFFFSTAGTYLNCNPELSITWTCEVTMVSSGLLFYLVFPSCLVLFVVYAHALIMLTPETRQLLSHNQSQVTAPQAPTPCPCKFLELDFSTTSWTKVVTYSSRSLSSCGGNKPLEIFRRQLNQDTGLVRYTVPLYISLCLPPVVHSEVIFFLNESSKSKQLKYFDF